MKKIYVVTEGDYPDDQIMSVHDNREDAELMAEPFDYSIEEYELNPPKPDYIKRGYKIYRVNMFQDGNLPKSPHSYGVQRCNYEWQVRDIGEAKFEECESVYYDAIGRCYYDDCADMGHNGEMIMKITVLAKDREHAIKITDGKREQLLANGMWPSA